MSGVVPTAPEQPTEEAENQVKATTAVPDAPPDYNSHFVPGPAGPAAPPSAGLPMGYYVPQQPGAIPLYHPTGGTHPIQYQPGKYPLTSQPAPIMWMPGPAPMPNCPPGLEYLAQAFRSDYNESHLESPISVPNEISKDFETQNLLEKLDNIHVLQHLEPVELMTRFETNNRYDIKNNVDQMVYIVTEDTDDFTRNAYRNLRPFVLRVTDCLGREIMTMQRPFRCTCCCFCCPCARQELEVQCPPGVTIGFVAEHWNLCRASYSIQNEKKESAMRVRGPCATYGCGSDSVFEVNSLDGASNIGSIIRKWNGFLSTMGNADHFEIRFPLALDVKMKAMIFGCCFLIDFMYFERPPPRRSSR